MNYKVTAEVFPNNRKEGKILAFAKITINDAIVIDGAKIIEGQKGLFVGMPSKKSTKGTYSDIVYISSKDLKIEINKVALAAYKSKGGSVESNSDDDLPF